MAICLDYQPVYRNRRSIVISVRAQLIAGALLLCALAGKVWIKLESTEVGYNLAKERSALVEMDLHKQELELELSVLKRSDNLANAAERRLGLVKLNPERARKVSTR